MRLRKPGNISSPVISSVVVSKNEFRWFAPPKLTKGSQWSIPVSVAKKLCRVASPMCYQHAPQPSWVKGVTLKGVVHSIQPGKVKVRYMGRMATRRILGGRVFSRQQVAFEGEGIYDTSTRKMQRLLIVGTGKMHWLQEETPIPPVPFNALIEWQITR